MNDDNNVDILESIDKELDQVNINADTTLNKAPDQQNVSSHQEGGMQFNSSMQRENPVEELAQQPATSSYPEVASLVGKNETFQEETENLTVKDSQNKPLEVQPLNNQNTSFQPSGDTIINPYIVSETQPTQQVDQNLSNTDIYQVKQENIKKRKNSGKFILPIIFLVLTIILGAFIYFKTNSSSNLVTDALKKFAGKPLEFIKFSASDYNIGNTFNSKGNISIKVSNAESLDQEYKKVIENVNKLENNFVYSQDLKKNNVYLKFESKLKGDSLLELKTVSSNDKQYIFIKGFIDEYIKVSDLKVINEAGVINKKDYIYVYEKCFDIIINQLEQEEVIKSNSKIMVNLKEVNAKKNAITLDNQLKYKIMQKIYEGLKDDARAKKTLDAISEEILPSIKKEAYPTESKKALDNINKSKTSLNIYTVGFLSKFIKIELETEQPKDIGGIINLLSYTIGKPNVLEKAEKRKDKEVILYRAEIEKSKDGLKAKIKEKNNKLIGTISMINQKNNFDLTFESFEKENEFLINFNLNSKELEKNKKYGIEATLNFVPKAQEAQEIKININAENTKGALEPEAIGKSVDLDKNYEEKLNNFIFVKLMEILSALSN